MGRISKNPTTPRLAPAAGLVSSRPRPARSGAHRQGPTPGWASASRRPPTESRWRASNGAPRPATRSEVVREPKTLAGPCGAAVASCAGLRGRGAGLAGVGYRGGHAADDPGDSGRLLGVAERPHSRSNRNGPPRQWSEPRSVDPFRFPGLLPSASGHEQGADHQQRERGGFGDGEIVEPDRVAGTTTEAVKNHLDEGNVRWRRPLVVRQVK